MGPLTAREPELGRLRDALARAATGDGSAVIIEGPAGIGKSRLLWELRRELADVRVLNARGSELERDFAFGVVRQLFESAAAGDGAESVLGAVDTTTDGASFATLHRLQWLTLDLAQSGPLLLAVDDLHWCDTPSLRFLAYLTHRLEGARALLVGATRSVALPLVADIATNPLTTVLRLGPLDVAAVSELLEERLGSASEALAEACQRATGGVPLLLDQLLRALGEGGAPEDAVAWVREAAPQAVSPSVLTRLARLDPVAVDVARAVAVLETGAPELVARVAGRPVTAVADATRELVGAGLFATGETLAFAHAVVRNAVLADRSPADRELLHARAATALHHAAAPADQIAVHLLAAGPDAVAAAAPGAVSAADAGAAAAVAWPAAALRTAAAAALGAGDAGSAAGLLQRALREPLPGGERAQVLVALGQAERGSDPDLATAHLRDGLAATEDPAERAAATVALAYVLLHSGRFGEIDALLADSAAGLGDGVTDVRRQLHALQLVALLHGGGDPNGIAAAIEHRALPAQPQLGDLMLGGMAAAAWQMGGRPVAVSSELAWATLADGRLIAAHNAGASFPPMLALVFADDPRAEAVLRMAFDRATSAGTLQEVYAARNWYGLLMLQRGQLVEAEQALTAAGQALDLIDLPAIAHTYLDAHRVLCALAAGDVATARERFDPATRAVRPTDSMRMLDEAELQLLAAEGEHARVLELADTFGQRYGAWLVTPVHGRRRALAGRALIALGDRDAGLARIETELEVARAGGAPGAIAAAARDLGLACGDDGIGLLEEAVGVSAGTAAVLEHARSLAALGAALRRARRPTEAREPLQTALALAVAGGITGLEADVRTELAAIGSRPRRAAFSGRAALTPSELRVAELAADGASNREIAQTLFVTTKTVEVHLSAAYRKLDIGSRRQLAPALAHPQG